jgi:murein DD-endopeptidase MepM/ murein hydrolase activator NlpD
MRDEGELYVTAQPARRVSRRALTADLEPDERRGWLYYGLASLGISALGLAAAGSLALTTNAQTTGDVRPAHTAAAVTAPAIAAGAGTAPAITKQQPAAVYTFARRPILTSSDDNRSAALRIAIVKEQAAQRAEELVKEAEDLTRAAQTASSDARQSKLTAADRASGLAAAKAADEKLRRAVAARVAAVLEREAHEAQERADATSTRRSSPERRSIPTGSSDNGGNSDGGGSDSGGSDSGGSDGGGGVSPVPGAVIGAHFGQYGVWSRYHTGLDFRAAYGTPIRAVKSGVVLFAGNKGDWAGNHVAIRHGDGRTTMSSHMSSMAVGSGQSVRAGQVIGYVGQTGRAFGAHLHFELYPAGVRYGDVYRAINPQPWLAANGVQTR